jgi:hypothetical protein
MKRQMQTKVLVGIPNSENYAYYNFKQPLSTFPTKSLQEAVNRIKAKLHKGEVILNTNLTELGIAV